MARSELVGPSHVSAARHEPVSSVVAESSTALRKPKRAGRELRARSQEMAGERVAWSELPAVFERDSYSATAFAEVLNRSTHAAIAKTTMGLSPAALVGAYFDWITHLATSPGKQLQLSEKAAHKWLRILQYASHCAMKGGSAAHCIEPLPQDKRFRDEAWQQWPFNIAYQSFLLTQQWWHNATTGVPGVTCQHERVVEFATRQMLDMFAPSNSILTNPEILRKTQAEAGQNFLRGFQYWMEDLERVQGRKPPAGAEAFRPGEHVAVTPGKVVFRNHLIELIQYAPSTGKVSAEPVLIVPAWIMKYYILDLSPANSMVKYLVDEGHTVFMISWRNPGPQDRDLGLDDYRVLGVEAALDAVSSIVPDRQVHGVGYCLGGTLLSIAAATLAREGITAFKSLSFFASQVDFTEAGELQMFINESQLSFLEDMMWEQGFLDTKQMAGTFQLLRSNDLIWSKLAHEYLMGERAEMIDLMAWNADATRMPYRMHSEYLRSLYLNNDLTEGRFEVEGRVISVTDIRAPVFAVGTLKDHVAPWPSVYKMSLLFDTDVTFALTSGGHNAGIVSAPGQMRRSYQIATKHQGDRYVDPDTWRAQTLNQNGSWWPAWVEWLRERSSEQVSPPAMGNKEGGFPAIAEAPGTYIFQT